MTEEQALRARICHMVGYCPVILVSASAVAAVAKDPSTGSEFRVYRQLDSYLLGEDDLRRGGS